MTPGLIIASLRYVFQYPSWFLQIKPLPEPAEVDVVAYARSMAIPLAQGRVADAWEARHHSMCASDLAMLPMSQAPGPFHTRSIHDDCLTYQVETLIV